MTTALQSMHFDVHMLRTTGPDGRELCIARAAIIGARVTPRRGVMPTVPAHIEVLVSEGVGWETVWRGRDDAQYQHEDSENAEALFRLLSDWIFPR